MYETFSFIIEVHFEEQEQRIRGKSGKKDTKRDASGLKAPENK